MLRSRVLKHWAGIIGSKSSELKIPENMREVLSQDAELTTADMKKWILRECDVAEYKYWMPHRIVSGPGYVRAYYVWVGPEPTPAYTIVLVVGAGRAEIHKWSGNNVEILPAKVEEKPKVARPDIGESLQIMNYLTEFKQKEPSMTVNGAKVAKIKRDEAHNDTGSSPACDLSRDEKK
jgi:hypothetical protein